MTASEMVDEHGRTPALFVLEYITERREWDLRAAVLSKAADENDDPAAPELEALYDGYAALMRRFATPALMRRGLVANFASPPDLDPSKTTINRVSKRGDLVRVVTDERVREGEEDQYEYLVRLLDGEWRLEDRRVRGLDGRWLNYLV